mmetsp:Transcript_66232/g.190362  ORF Transcript_66232/g.190362 Transcript_66232/m.190362 type:complete len:228 (+) Transcript_66232:89-772(+)
MPAVLGIEILDGGMAGLAKKLLNAHICVIVLVLLCDLMNVIRYAIQASAVASISKKFGEKSGFEEDGAMGGLPIVLATIIGATLCISIAFLLARSAVDGNNRYALRCICWCDGCCGCFSFCTLIQAVIGILGVSSMKSSLDGLACTSGDAEGCQEFTNALNSMLGTVNLLLILLAAIAGCQAFTFCFGAFNANEADQAIQAGLKFTDVNIAIVNKQSQSMQPWKMFP